MATNATQHDRKISMIDMAVAAHDERDTTRPYQLLVTRRGDRKIPAVAGGLTLGLRPGPISVRPAGGPNPAVAGGLTLGLLPGPISVRPAGGPNPAAAGGNSPAYYLGNIRIRENE